MAEFPWMGKRSGAPPGPGSYSLMHLLTQPQLLCKLAALVDIAEAAAPRIINVKQMLGSVFPALRRPPFIRKVFQAPAARRQQLQLFGCIFHKSKTEERCCVVIV